MAQAYTGEVMPLDPNSQAVTQNHSPDGVQQLTPLETEILANRTPSVPTQVSGGNVGGQVQNTANQALSDAVNKMSPGDYLKYKEGMAASQDPNSSQYEPSDYYSKGNQLASQSFAQAGTPVLKDIPYLKDVPSLGQLGRAPMQAQHAGWNMIQGLTTTGLAAGDWLDKHLGDGKNANLAAQFDQAHPAYPPADNAFDRQTEGVMQLGAGIMGGEAAAARAIPEVAAGFSPLVGSTLRGANTAGHLAAQSVGFAAAAPHDARQQVPVLDNYIPGEQKQLDNNSPDFASDTLNNVGRNAADMMGTGAIMGGGFKLARGAWDLGPGPLISGLKNWKNSGTMQNTNVQQLADRVLGINQDTAPAVRKAAYQDLAKFAQNPQNNTTNVAFGDSGMSDVSHNRDTISVLMDYLKAKDPQMSTNTQAIIKDLQTLRTSLSNSGKAPQLNVALDQPQRAFNQATSELQASRGGPQAAQNTQNVLTQQGQNTVNTAQNAVNQTQAALDQSKQSATDLMRKDQNFGPIIRDAEAGGANPNLGARSTELQNQTLENVHASEQAQRAERNAAHGAIPEGTPADMNSFNTAYANAKGSLPPNIQQMIDNNNGTYDYLFNTVKPRLSEYIGQLQKTPQPGLNMGPLYDLQNNIRKEQLGALSGSENHVTASAAQEATKADTAYANRYNQGVGEDLKQNARNYPPDKKPVDFYTSGRETLMKSLSQNSPEKAQQLRDILNTDAGHQSGDLVDKILLNESAQHITDMMANKFKGAGDTQLSDFTSQLQNYARNMSPELQGQVQNFLDNLKTHGVNSQELQSQLANLKAQAKDAEDQVYKGHLAPFFKDLGGQKVPATGDVLGGIMNGKNNGDQLDDLLSRTQSDPVARRGLEVSAARAIADAGSNGGQIPDEMMQKANKIWANNPAIPAGLKAISEEANNIGKNVKSGHDINLDSGNPQGEMLRSARTAITWVFGQLSHTGAIARNITTTAINDNSSEGLARKAVDAIVANSQTFGDIVNKISRNQGVLSPQMKKTLFRIVTQGGLNMERTPDVQTSQALTEQGQP